MNRFSCIAVSLLLALFAAGTLGQTRPAQQPPTPAQRPGRQIVATYFHGDLRCATCKKLEAYARDAVEKTFPAEIVSGTVAFKTVNVDRPENEDFNHDYSLVTRSLVITEELNGKVVRWTNLDKIWQLVRDEVAYKDYVVEGVRRYLDNRT